MGGSSPAGNTVTTSTANPWAGEAPYLKQGYGAAGNWYGQGGTQVAGFNPTQQQAFQGISNLANTGAGGLYPTSANSLNNFMSGKMVNSNPYLSQMANAADQSIVRNYQTAVAPGIQSQMAGAGRYGSGAMANAQSQAQQDLATQLGNTNANIYGNAYQQGMGQMLQANALAPSTANLGLGLQNALGGVGQQQQSLQQQINAQPLTNIQNYLGMISGASPGTGQATSQPYFTNPTANTIGAGLGGYALYKMFSGG